MAIIDANNYFTTIGSPFAPTVAGQENLAPNSIDTATLGLPSGSQGSATTGYNSGSSTNAGRDLGVGTEFWLEVLVTTAVAQAANNTNFFFVTDSVAALSNVASQTGVGVLLESPAFTAAQLAVQAVWRTQLPAGLNYKEFLGLDVYINSTNWTAGAVEAKLLPNIQQSDLYLSGFAIQ
jgi:hypothetical protein